MGKQALLYPDIDSVDDILAKIDAVKIEDIQRLSQELFKEGKMRMAMIGPFKNDKHFAELLHY